MHAVQADHVATVPRCPVGQDDILPVDHIGRLQLGGGMQLFYIAHSDTDPEGLWSSALNIGNSNAIVNMEYFDSQDGDGALCGNVCSALSITKSVFAEHFLMCTKVGDFIAVGLGGNKKSRKRSSRVAAAVCFELQAASPVEEFRCYPGPQSLIKQVRSCCNFDVR